MVVSPAAFGFSTEYRGDHPGYDDFDEYLRVEFPERHPGWEPRFGRASWFDPDLKRYDYLYLLSGNVPDAESHADAEHKVTQLLHDIAREFKAFRPDIKKALPEPITKVWHSHR
jgi:hypothetical protein